MKDIKIKIEKTGKIYQLQHPGAERYFDKEAELTQITGDGYIQINKKAMFDFCFGKNSQAEKVVFTESGEFVDWRKAQEEPTGYTPSLSELSDVWFIILQSFLRGSLSQDKDKKEEWSFVSNASNNNQVQKH